MKKLSHHTLLLLLIICCFGCNKYYSPPGVVSRATPVVVILGSSTAAGTGANPIDSAWAYRLASTYKDNTHKATFINLAVDGNTLYQAMPSGNYVAGRPVPDTTANINRALQYHPNLVMLSFPSNDIAANYSDNEILNNYAKLASMLDSAKVEYIIFSTQPRDFSDPAQRMRLKTLNDEIKAIYTYHVNDFLDQLSTSTYSINPLYSAGDGIHINNAGHAIIYNATIKHPIFIKVVE